MLEVHTDTLSVVVSDSDCRTPVLLCGAAVQVYFSTSIVNTVFLVLIDSALVQQKRVAKLGKRPGVILAVLVEHLNAITFVVVDV